MNFKCSTCNASYTWSSGLSRHRKLHHNIANVSKCETAQINNNDCMNKPNKQVHQIEDEDDDDDDEINETEADEDDKDNEIEEDEVDVELKEKEVNSNYNPDYYGKHKQNSELELIRNIVRNKVATLHNRNIIQVNNSEDSCESDKVECSMDVDVDVQNNQNKESCKYKNTDNCKMETDYLYKQVLNLWFELKNVVDYLYEEKVHSEDQSTRVHKLSSDSNYLNTNNGANNIKTSSYIYNGYRISYSDINDVIDRLQILQSSDETTNEDKTEIQRIEFELRLQNIIE